MNSTTLATGKQASFARRGSRILAATTVAALTLGASLVMAPAASAAEGDGTVSGDVIIGGQPATDGYVSIYNQDVFLYAFITDGSYVIPDVPAGDDYTVALVATDPADEHGYVNEVYEPDPEAGGGHPQTVTAGESTDIDFSTKYSLTMNYDESFTDEVAVGDTAEYTPGTWANADIASTIQWYSNDVAIEGATGTSLVVAPEYAGGYLSVTQTGIKPNSADTYYPSEYTASTYVPAKDFESVGEAELDNYEPAVGDVLTMSATSDSVPAASSYEYQWYVSGQDGTYATTKSIVVTEDLVGEQIDGFVGFVLPGYSTQYSYVGMTASVTSPKLTATTAVKVTGTSKIGSTLKATAPVWSTTPSKVTYQWYRNDNNLDLKKISGATSSSYKIPAKYAGSKFLVKATATKTGFAAGTSQSSYTKTAPYLKATAKTPTLSGTFKVGKTIKVKTGSWKPSGMKFSYMWLLNGREYKITTSTSLKLTSAAKGKTVTVIASGYKDGYGYTAKKSKTSAKVK